MPARRRVERHALTLTAAASQLERSVVNGAPRGLKADEVAGLHMRMSELAGVAAQVDLALVGPGLTPEEHGGLVSLRLLLEDAGEQVHGVLERAGGSLPPLAQQRAGLRQPLRSGPLRVKTEVGPRESVSQAGGLLPPPGDEMPMPTREEDAQFFDVLNEALRRHPAPEDTRSLGYGATVFFENNPASKVALANRIDRWLDEVAAQSTTSSIVESVPPPPKSGLLSSRRAGFASAAYGSAAASLYDDSTGVAGAADSLPLRQQQLARSHEQWGTAPRMLPRR